MSSSLYRALKLAGSFKKLRRFRDIASILARHGFADVASRTRFGKVLRVARKIVSLGHWKEKEAISTGARLRSICEELGATFIKFGQVLANRPDLLPQEVITELSRLQDEVPPFPFDEVRRILAAELGTDPDELFEAIDGKPLAAASIAQVHRARLRSGEEVVIKVKRPGLEQTVREDLAVLRDIAAYIEDNFPELEHIRPRSLVEEFARTFAMEMDLRAEARNLERFARNFEDEPAVRVPRVFKALSTSDVLVMEYLRGFKVTQVKDWSSFPRKPQEIAEIGTRLLLRSVFEYRFYHADPHPGNFMVSPDGTICLLDFGMVGYVSESRMEDLLSFMVGLVSYDSQILVESILEAGLAPATLKVREFQRDVELMMNQFASLSLEEMDLEFLLRTAIETIYKHRISLPTDLLGVARAISTMEGIARQIYPEFNPLQAVQPYLISLFVKRALDPAHQADQLVDGVLNLGGLVRQIPKDFSDALKRLKEGELTLRVNDVHALETARTEARSRNRFVGSLLSLTGVGASFFLHSLPTVPEWVPWTSFSASFLIAVWVVNGIRRSGGM
jgi:ubiquinone biosynthesis protein